MAVVEQEYVDEFYFVIVLLAFELIVLSLFIILSIKKQQQAFQFLVLSIFLFILENGFTLTYVIREHIQGILFFQGLLAACGLAPIVIFLEMFENGQPYTQRSTFSMIFLLLIGAVKGASKLLTIESAGPLETDLGKFFNFISPFLYILVGSFYINTISKIKHRIRFENQKHKLRRVKTGVYLTFILPKFTIGAIIFFSIAPTVLFGFNTSEFIENEMLFDIILNYFQIIGIIVMSTPFISSQSVFFMQSRKISTLSVINKESIPLFQFQFEKTKNEKDDLILIDAIKAVGTIMKGESKSFREIRSFHYGDSQIMVDIRENFAVLLIVDKPTLFLNKSLESFANNFNIIFPKNLSIEKIRYQKLKFTAEKMIQESFGLADDEFLQIKNIVGQGFDKICEQYLKTRIIDSEEIRILKDFINRLPRDSRVLDAGCGAGEPITRLLAEKFETIGVDISRKQLKTAKKLVPNAKFERKDMTSLSYPDDYFDGIVSYHAIPHIPREEHKNLIDNFNRMIHPKGFALLCFATDDDPGKVVDDYFGVKMFWSSFDAGTNIEMLEDSGFIVIWVKLIFDETTDEQELFVLVQKEEGKNPFLDG